MPLTAKGNEIMAAMKSQYGEKKGEEVFYASKNAGKISGVDSDEERADSASDYRIKVTEKVNRSIGMRNVHGNIRERKHLVFTVERKHSNGEWHDVGFEWDNRAKAQSYIDRRSKGDSDNPIDLNIPEYARVHAALDSMAEQISSLGSRARSILGRIDEDKTKQHIERYNRNRQSEEEAKLRTPEGEAERQRKNAERVKSFRKDAEALPNWGVHASVTELERILGLAKRLAASEKDPRVKEYYDDAVEALEDEIQVKKKHGWK